MKATDKNKKHLSITLILKKKGSTTINKLFIINDKILSRIHY